ncbi:MAG: hypothetical protein WD696_16825 [Bryobacteraceae bacterium]
MTIFLASLLTVGVIVYILAIRERDLPAPEPPSPFAHLDERKASIYENLRDLQFEYRLGKLSDGDYQQTKTDLQKELAVVMAEVDRIKEQIAPQGKVVTKAPQAKANTCPSCGARFTQQLKFCGECGQPMAKAEKA